MRSRLAAGIAAAALVPALLAGCGGGESEEKPGSEKQRYIEQSDAICRDAFSQASGIGSGRDRASAQKGIDVWTAASDKLKPIPIPRESEELAKQFVTDVENLSLAYTQAERSAELNDQTDVDEAYRDVDMIKKRAAETADKYGYEVCKDIDRV